jgi:hypothetical protein
MTNDLTFELLQQGRISTEEYLILTRRRLDNISEILPEWETADLLVIAHQVDMMRWIERTREDYEREQENTNPEDDGPWVA